MKPTASPHGFFLYHLIFGATLFLVPIFERAFTRNVEARRQAYRPSSEPRV